MFLENLSPKYLLALINQYYILHSGFETPQRPHNTVLTLIGMTFVKNKNAHL